MTKRWISALLACAILLVACTNPKPNPGVASGAPKTTSAPAPRYLVPKLTTPEAIALDGHGNMFVSDCPGHRIFRLGAHGAVTVLGRIEAGGIDNGFAGDGGPATKAVFSCPAGLALHQDGNLFVADHANNRVRMIDTRGIVSTVAGSGPVGVNLGGYAGDGGPATRAQLSEPLGIALDGRGNLFIADRDNSVIREVGRNGVITTIAGNGTDGYSGDGGPATSAQLADPEYVVVDQRGDVYFTDQTNERVRMIDPSGTISTVAGTGSRGYSGDGGPAVDARLADPYGLAIDSRGDLYVSDSSNHVVRMIDPNGIITTVAGTGVAGSSGDGGPAIDAQLRTPSGLAVDAAGNLFISDADGGAVRRVTPDGTIETIATSG